MHFDGYDEHGATREDFIKGGQRLFTTICYLNDIEDEGQTAFPKLEDRSTPETWRGFWCLRMIFWDRTRCIPTAPTSGSGRVHGLKWVLTVWWREHHFHIPRSYPPADGDFLVY